MTFLSKTEQSPYSDLSDITVVELTKYDEEALDNYVVQAANGLPLHLSGWQTVMQRTYGYETRTLMAQLNGQIVGVLPLFFVPSRLMGKRAMTMPGGLCADDEHSASLLIEEGLATAVAHNINRLTLQDSRQAWPNSTQTSNNHVHWLCELADSEEATWQQLDGNIRRQVRKARKNGLTVEIDRNGTLLEPFYDVFSRFTHQAGTPVYGRLFLENIITQFPDGFNIAIVSHEGQPIAGYFQLMMADTVYGMWGAALPQTLKLRPVYLALWAIMADAVANGYSKLDMGRSPAGSNASKFKGQWGGEAHPIYQQNIIYGKVNNTNIMTNEVQSDSKMQLFMRLWPKLPLAATRMLGPKLRWHIPFA